ncbi:hypothetical protein ACRRTK_014018 [Alexandromys fortis]
MRQFQNLPASERKDSYPGFPFCLLSHVLKKQSFVTMFLETKLYCHWCLYHMVLEKQKRSLCGF